MAIIDREIVRLAVQLPNGKVIDLTGYVTDYQIDLLQKPFYGADVSGYMGPPEIRASFSFMGDTAMLRQISPLFDSPRAADIGKPVQQRLECRYCEQWNDLANECCNFCGGRLKGAKKIGVI